MFCEPQVAMFNFSNQNCSVEKFTKCYHEFSRTLLRQYIIILQIVEMMASTILLQLLKSTKYTDTQFVKNSDSFVVAASIEALSCP